MATIYSRKKTWPFPTGKPTSTDIERQKLADEEVIDLNDVPTTEEAYRGSGDFEVDEEVLRRTTRGLGDHTVDHNWIETGYD